MVSSVLSNKKVPVAVILFLASIDCLSQQCAAAADTALSVVTVYDSMTCSGSVVQNNYFVSSDGICKVSYKASPPPICLSFIDPCSSIICNRSIALVAF